MACSVASSITGNKSARCDLRPGKPQCTDWRDSHTPSTVTFQGVCNTLGGATGSGTFADDAKCDITDMIGGCQSSSTDGSKQTNWFYKSTQYPDATTAQKECSSGSTFVGPQ